MGLGVRTFDELRVSVFACSISAGSANPSTVLRSRVASSESFAMDAAVADVALPVWLPISFNLVVRRVTSAAAPACCRAELEMFCTRLAIWLDTCSISSSAAPASSPKSRGPKSLHPS